MEIEMTRLGTGMLARYEIEQHRSAAVNVVQFGLSEALLGAVDRLIDDANAAGLSLGIVAVEAGEKGRAARLRAQDGLYTVIQRGYVGDAPVYREQVVQAILDAVEPDGLDALASNAGLALGIVDDAPGARVLAARFAEMRRAAGLPDLAWLSDENMLVDALAFRSDAKEAAKLCADMNYLDDMLYLAEPFVRLTICAPEDFRRRFPLDRASGVRFADAAGFEAERRLKRRVFDAGLCLMAAPGWLNGCDTLRDCMTHERIRRFVGEAFTGELLPLLTDIDRAEAEARVIESFGRYENPLTQNRVLSSARRLLDRFIEGPLELMRRYAEENFEPPRRMAFALASTIMLYAGARLNPSTGRYEVARGKAVEALDDDPERLATFATLAHDMPPETLAYAALADREIWGGRDLREIDGLEARVALDIAAMQRDPRFLPESE